MRTALVMLVWISSVAATTAFMYRALVGNGKTYFVPGTTSDGHYQFEERCELCHTPFAGVKQDACTQCHADELDTADDSHPRAKFTDPRNVDRVDRIDARLCTTCHVEHRPDFTENMGVTQPRDYCWHCHDDIARERPSHAGMGFATCADAGCHNFHDNRALSADYLRAHAEGPEILANAAVVGRRPRSAVATVPEPDGGAHNEASAVAEWTASAHAVAKVNCTACHEQADGTWLGRPGQDACRGCHADAVAGFLHGRHGMRLAQQLAPMTPRRARRAMRPGAEDTAVTCNSCHGVHRYDTGRAAVEACLGCHADEHSLGYLASPHAQTWRREQGGAAPAGTGVSCATCHMPRAASGEGVVSVEHNQNDNLRPNEKMIRTVCAACHGLALSIDALADRALVNRNFAGRPARHVPSIEMAEKSAGAGARP